LWRRNPRCYRKCTLGVDFVPVDVVLSSLRSEAWKTEDIRILRFFGGIWDRRVDREGIREVRVGI
jgi:hypothetical protein